MIWHSCRTEYLKSTNWILKKLDSFFLKLVGKCLSGIIHKLIISQKSPLISSSLQITIRIFYSFHLILFTINGEDLLFILILKKLFLILVSIVIRLVFLTYYWCSIMYIKVHKLVTNLHCWHTRIFHSLWSNYFFFISPILIAVAYPRKHDKPACDRPGNKCQDDSFFVYCSFRHYYYYSLIELNNYLEMFQMSCYIHFSSIHPLEKKNNFLLCLRTTILCFLLKLFWTELYTDQ